MAAPLITFTSKQSKEAVEPYWSTMMKRIVIDKDIVGAAAA